jgi:hypothetical protein
MKSLAAGALVLILGLALLGLAPTPQQPAQHDPMATPAQLRFQALDLFIDSGDTPLAAYQVEIRAAAAHARLVGVEGGEPASGPFVDPPYYDPAALHEDQLAERIILAAFSTAHELPTGRTRVARIHVQVSGDAQYASDLLAAGNADGQRINATLHLEPVQQETRGDKR